MEVKLKIKIVNFGIPGPLVKKHLLKGIRTWPFQYRLGEEDIEVVSETAENSKPQVIFYHLPGNGKDEIELVEGIRDQLEEKFGRVEKDIWESNEADGSMTAVLTFMGS